MKRSLTDTKKAVLDTIRMRLSEREALLYLEGMGFSMKRRMYYKHKAELNAKKLERLHFIAKIGFEDQHLDRIDTCELIARLHWQNFLMEKNPFKKSMILKEIKELQPYISTYYEATKGVIGQSNGARQDTASVSDNTAATDSAEPDPEPWTV